jgi:hypothetical protein
MDDRQKSRKLSNPRTKTLRGAVKAKCKTFGHLPSNLSLQKFPDETYGDMRLSFRRQYPMQIPNDSDRSCQIFKREADNTTVCVEVVKDCTKPESASNRCVLFRRRANTSFSIGLPKRPSIPRNLPSPPTR